MEFDKERLKKIKVLHEEAISLYPEVENGSFAAEARTTDILKELFSKEHTDWLIEQAEKFGKLQKEIERLKEVYGSWD